MHLRNISFAALIALLTNAAIPFTFYFPVLSPATRVLAQASSSRKTEADKLIAQGSKQFQASQFKAALQSWQQALSFYQDIKDRKGEGIAQILLGSVYLKMKNFAKAIEYSQQSLAIARDIKDQTVEGLALKNLGLAYYSLDDYAKGIEYFQQTLALARDTKDRKQEGESLYVLGSVYRFLGDYAKAIDYFQKSLTIVQELKDRRMEGNVLSGMGYAYGYQDNYSKTIQLEQKALTIAREIKDRRMEAAVLNILGQAAHFLQHDYRTAINYYQQGLTIAREIKYRESESGFLVNIGVSYDALGDSDRAIEYHQQSLKLVREFKDSYSQGITLNYLGLALLRAGKLEEAQKTLLAGIQVWESIRTKLGSIDALKVSFFDKQAETYDLLQRVFVAQNQPLAALEVSERSRARAFVDLLAKRLTSPSNVATITPPSLQLIQQTAKAQNATLVEYSVIYDDLKGRGKPQSQESKLYIWVIKPTGEVTFRQVDLKTLTLLNVAENSRVAAATTATSRSSIANLVNTTRSAIRSTHDNASNEQATATEVSCRGNRCLKQMYSLLIEPIADLLPTNPENRVIFIPHQSLFLVPFAALTDGQDRYLIEKHTILIAPSIQLLDLTHQQRQRIRQAVPQNSVVVGIKRNALVVGNPTMPKVPSRIGEPPELLDPLSGAEAEAKAIAGLLKTQALTGNQATKATVVQQMAGARIIHLATHGFLDDLGGMGVPGAIALAPSGKDNGLLTANEVLDLNLNAELVVLSACDTGRGRITGDGVIGLSRSFITAGTPSVVVSLWKVSDESTAFLMPEFYRQLQQNYDKAKALRQAMLVTMKQHPNPSDWAAFALIGEAE